jgi:acetyl esterase/lipase
LCARTDAIVVSSDYRHAPEHPFPAAVDDAMAALRWIADNAEALGGIPGQLAVCGWSAGGNLAAVVCRLAHEAGGPDIVAQALLMPMTDSDTTRGSYLENGDGYLTTTASLRWCLDHYADPAHLDDPLLAPLRAENLAGLPPAIVVTADFDPLRDDGDAYAEALRAAGVQTEHIRARGHIHRSLTLVDVVISGAPVRARIANALRQIFAATRTPEPAA